MASLPHPLATARQAAGLSQAQLAARSGVSRQTVSAIESGRHRPSVDAALALARTVGTTVETLFAPPAGQSVGVLAGSRVDPGAGVFAARVGDRLVHASAGSALGHEGWPAPNARLDGDTPTPLPGADLDGFVAVGCDPALALAASLLPASGPQHVIAISGSTAAGADALRGGRTHAAVVHGPADGLPEAPAGTLRIELARWRVGVALGAGVDSLEQIAAGGVDVVQREAGASSQRAFADALRAGGAETLPAGPIEDGHIAVARRVAAGAAAGVTMEPAAISHGLAFTPLEEHTAELWVGANWRGHPAAEALARVLRSAAFTARLALVGGYDLAGTGLQRSA